MHDNYVTHNDHFQFGWGNGIFNFDDKSGLFWVKFGRASYQPVSFRKECVRAAGLIAQHAKKPVLVCYSGGIDSEIVVRSFIEAKADFEIVIMKLKFGDDEHINDYDTTYAFDFVKEHHLKYRTITIDMEDFIRNTVTSQCQRYASDLWGIILHTQLVKLFPDFHCVFGGGDIYLQRHRFNGRPEKAGMFLEEELISLAPIEAAYELGGGATNRFFMHTPELMLAFLTDSDISHWIKYEVATCSRFTNMNYFAIKPYMYYRHWPDMTIRPKYNGFESMMAELKRDVNLNTDIRLILENASTYKKREIIIDHETLLEWLTPVENQC